MSYILGFSSCNSHKKKKHMKHNGVVAVEAVSVSVDRKYFVSSIGSVEVLNLVRK
jgi:hypothetical protein